MLRIGENLSEKPAKSETKAQLRERFKIQAKDFFAHHGSAALVEIHAQVAAALAHYAAAALSPDQCRSPRVAVYQPFKVELPARAIVSASGAFENPQFVYPQVDGEKMWFTDESGNLADPDIVIVPGLFVDHNGNRLGRGKGYYDRYLREKQPALACRIFLGYPFQFIDAVPTDERDERVTPLALPNVLLP
ncbi:MAG: 5-formyltetrahydrofolate cyclo-ligase [Spirochaetota bacterium]